MSEMRITQFKTIKIIGPVLDREWSDALLDLMRSDSADPSSKYIRDPYEPPFNINKYGD